MTRLFWILACAAIFLGASILRMLLGYPSLAHGDKAILFLSSVAGWACLVRADL